MIELVILILVIAILVGRLAEVFRPPSTDHLVPGWKTQSASFDLVSVDGLQTYQLWPVELVIVGRAPRCDIPLFHPSVEPMHARLLVDDGVLFVTDLRSRHGTFINGVRLKGGAKARNEDTVGFGETRFNVVRVSRSERLDPAIEDAPRLSEGIVDASGTFRPSRTLQEVLGSGYKVGELLGYGAFGEVYRVRDLTLNRDVAVKVLHYTTSEVLERFRREATILAQLRHPHIVPVFFVGFEPEGTYMVMPLLRGESLRATIARERSFAPVEVSRIATQVAAALDETHAKSIVHRDIKPENIFLEGERRTVQVMDFGIAKDITIKKAHGSIIGTLEYMSPEQCSGDPAIDGRADVYALGCVVHELLVGAPPFPASALPPLAVMSRHIGEPPPPIRAARPDYSEETERVLLAALAKSPAERFSTAGAFARSLARSMGQ